MFYSPPYSVKVILHLLFAVSNEIKRISLEFFSLKKTDFSELITLHDRNSAAVACFASLVIVIGRCDSNKEPSMIGSAHEVSTGVVSAHPDMTSVAYGEYHWHTEAKNDN